MAGRFLACVLILLSLSSIVSASSLDVSNWSFRRNIVLSASKALSDYPVKVLLDTQDLIAAGKMRSDCADIRFTDSDRFSTMSYFLESGCNTNETVFYVNVPIVVPEKKIYIYYGFSKAVSESSGEDTFVFFDGFEGDSLDLSKWFPQTCVSVNGGYAHLYSLEENCSLKLAAPLPNTGVIHLKARRGANETGNGPGFSVSYLDNSPAFKIGADQAEGRWFLYTGKPSSTSVYGGAADRNDHLFRVAYDVSGRIYYFYVDSSQVTKNRAYSPGALASLDLLSGDSPIDRSMGDSYYDYFFIRKYTESESEVNLLDEESLKTPATLAARSVDGTTPSSAALTTTIAVSSSAVATSMRMTPPSSIVLRSVSEEKNSSNSSSQTEESVLSIWSFITPIIVILVVFAILALFALYSRRKKESLEGNKEVLRWIATELLSGEDPEVVKKAVRDSGMDPSLVDAAKKTLK
jgi:hypothetical protein